MLASKKYIKQEQYNYNLVTIPEKEGGKLFLYFKRYTPKSSNLNNIIKNSESIYEAIQQINQASKNNKDQSADKNNQDSELDFPLNRTIMAVNFDKSFYEEKLKKIFQLLGKVRKVVVGSYKNKKKVGLDGKQIKNVYFGIIVFKNEYNLNLCFDVELFQSKIDNYYKYEKLKQDEDGKDTYIKNLLEKYEKKEENKSKEELIKKMQQGDFKLVTNFKGDFIQNNFLPETQSSQIEESTNSKKKKKRSLKLNDFYRFQVSKKKLEGELGQVDDNVLTDKELIKKRKMQLLQEFEKDKETIKQLKQIRQENKRNNQKVKIQDNDSHEENAMVYEDDDEDDDDDEEDNEINE